MRRVALLLGIMVLLCGCGSAGPADAAPSPPTAAQLPLGAAPSIPYVRATTRPYDENGVLHVHGKVVARHVTGVLAAGSTVLALRNVVTPRSAAHPLGTSAFHVARVADGRETSLPALTTTGDQSHSPAASPTLSPGGRYAATVQQLSGNDTDRVSEWSFGEHRLVGSIVLPSIEDGVIIDGIADDGRVYLTVWTRSSQATFRVWRPGHPTHPWPKAAATAARSGSLGFASNGPVVLPDTDEGGVLTPDGTEAAYATTSGTRAEVFRPATGHRVRLNTPGVVSQMIGFENDASVLLLSIRPHSHDDWVLRCSTTSGTCRRAMRMPAHGELVFARLFWSM